MRYLYLQSSSVLMQILQKLFWKKKRNFQVRNRTFEDRRGSRYLPSPKIRTFSRNIGMFHILLLLLLLASLSTVSSTTCDNYQTSGTTSCPAGCWYTGDEAAHPDYTTTAYSTQYYSCYQNQVVYWTTSAQQSCGKGCTQTVTTNHQRTDSVWVANGCSRQVRGREFVVVEVPSTPSTNPHT